MNAPLAVNPLVAAVGSPPIPAAQGWLARYDGARGPVLNLSQAVPSNPPHDAILARLGHTASDGASAGYGPITGDPALRAAYAVALSATYGARILPEETAITAGCNQAFVVTMMALAKAGDAVVLPAPWYFNHKMTLDMLGIAARILPCEAGDGFVPDVAAAAALLDERTRAIVLVTPNNPTGAVYPPETIAAFHALCRERGLWLVLDETYRDFLPAQAACPHPLYQRPDWRDNLIQLYSFSKAYCIPGYRLGAVTAGSAVIAELMKILDCVQICPSRIAQPAMAWAIGALGDWRAENRDEIARRADALRVALSGTPGWAIDSLGAYFAYLRHPFACVPTTRVAERLAVERGVLGLPGGFFDSRDSGHLRLAFANVGAEAIGTLAARLEGFTPG
jgi:aspartate/methionine/tyrosine aminotransferase